jgi:TDG/mug DNA glycosylase family protein
VAVTDNTITVVATRARTLPDIVGPGLRLLVSGLNPSLYAADTGVAYGRPGNRFWPAALAAGLVTVDRDPWHARRHHGVGFTDLVKRASVGAAELTAAEYRHGLDRLDHLGALIQPGAIAFCGITGWRAATGDKAATLGWQERRVGGRPAYVLPNPSGLNAHANVAVIADHLRAAADYEPS